MSQNHYDEKSDIYSLGIIFFELHNYFSTKMMRAKAVENLKNNIISSELVQKYPKQMELVLSMISPNPSQRPSALDILKSELFNTYKHYRLKKELETKDLTISLQQKTIQALVEQREKLLQEMSALKKKLKEKK